MKKRFALFGCLLFAAQFFAQKPAKPPKPALGLHAGWLAGSFRFPKTSLYAQGKMDNYTVPVFGGFARLHLTKRFYIQPEVSFFKREVRSDFEYSYKIAATQQIVRYRVGGEQQVSDGGLFGYYRFSMGRLRPYAGGGMTIGFHKEKTIFQKTNASGAGWKRSDIKNSENDTGVAFGAGAEWAAGKNLLVLLEGRYSIAGTNWGTSENEIQKINFTTNATLHRVILRAGAAWQF